jgi:hypothetical protein
MQTGTSCRRSFVAINAPTHRRCELIDRFTQRPDVCTTEYQPTRIHVIVVVHHVRLPFAMPLAGSELLIYDE